MLTQVPVKTQALTYSQKSTIAQVISWDMQRTITALEVEAIKLLADGIYVTKLTGGRSWHIHRDSFKAIHAQQMEQVEAVATIAQVTKEVESYLEKQAATLTRHCRSLNQISKSLWQVIGAAGNAYEVTVSRNSYGFISTLTCTCKAGRHNRDCYHKRDVKEAIARQDSQRIATQNQAALTAGTKVLGDGSVAIDERFYQLMGKGSQVRRRRR